jgi:hypothetical protein
LAALWREALSRSGEQPPAKREASGPRRSRRRRRPRRSGPRPPAE